jgi:hypothetical protein
VIGLGGSSLGEIDDVADALPMELPVRGLRPGDMRSRIRLAMAALVIVLALAACAASPGASGPIDGAAAARLALAQQARFAGIGPLDDTLIGQAAWYEATTTDDGWQVVIRIGWGDCPAGCINEHRWTYAVGRDASVELIHEEGDALPDATGVRGTVTSGPTCPVETQPPDPACAARPVAGAVLVLTNAAGAEVGRVASAADGTFTVELAPGVYHLTAQPVEGLMGTPEPLDVEVEAGQPMTELQVSYDTGIR